MKGSKDIERNTLGLQTNRQTDSCKTIRPLFQEGHKNNYQVLWGYVVQQFLKKMGPYLVLAVIQQTS